MQGAQQKNILLRLAGFVAVWLREQIPLFEAVMVALMLHVLMLPVLWVIGWALPWPKSPVITTIIEYDLGNWPNVAKPKKIFDVHDPELNK